jgi:hypothetical protein
MRFFLNHRSLGVLLAGAAIFLLASLSRGDDAEERLPLTISWGHRSPPATSFTVGLVGERVTIEEARGQGLESGEGNCEGTWQSHAGGGDIDGVSLVLRFPRGLVSELKALHPIWHDLIAQSDPDTTRRLLLDPAIRRDPRKLTIRLNKGGTRGFSVTIDQLLQHRSFWVPSLDVYMTAGDHPVAFADHQEELARWKGRSVLDRVHQQPEASYADYTALWSDMGNPAYAHPRQPPPGHAVCLTWDSAIPKFGIDRGAGVWSDLGNPDHLHFWFDLGDLTRDLKRSWKGQRLEGGLPIVTTILEDAGLRCEVEQFAYPLEGPPQERRGDIAMVLLQSLKLINRDSNPREMPLRMTCRRQYTAQVPSLLTLRKETRRLVVQRSDSQEDVVSIEGDHLRDASLNMRSTDPGENRLHGRAGEIAEIRLAIDLPAGASRELAVKLPSPVVRHQDRQKLADLDVAKARAETVRFWSEYLARGACFQVPETVVNDLFRASLWHALRLPRRHGGQAPGVKIDLPYSNFAYDQNGTPWPINQAVYVDDMIYNLRGYPDTSLEELSNIYRTNQDRDGRIGGYANWGVYTPGMIYASARYFLLSQDRAGFERLLSPTLRSLDWCLREIQSAAGRPGSARGLVAAPLNDGTGKGLWAFNQAYFHAGLATLGLALEKFGHPRAGECLVAASDFQRMVETSFAEATVKAPLVQLRDHTWTPFVPCEALTPHRLAEQWYPTDVDTGPLHLLRLKTISSEGELADALLNDHEDNLYFKGWGMANEPVYNPQSMAYLLRDDPKAAIRSFYSYMACAFSHSVLEPVEHRWTWGQYFGPPSTDGAWFELYRCMLIRELDDGGLLLFQATPRRWLDDGKRIKIQRAPTYYGKLSMTMESQAASGQLRAEIDPPGAADLRTLLIRFRHPNCKPMRWVTVNGREWGRFEPAKEWVRIEAPFQRHYAVTVNY